MDHPIKERLGDVMGGKILTLKSEELRQEGRTEGRTEGRAEGRAEGRTEGRNEEKRKIAVRMQASGMPVGQKQWKGFFHCWHLPA